MGSPTRGTAVLLLAALLATACGSAPASTAGKGPAQAKAVNLGVILSLTGPAAGVGIANKQGIDLALGEINQAGGVLGHPIRLIYEDDQSNPSQANTAAVKLIEQDGVTALLGASITPTGLAAAQVSNSKHVVQLVPSMTGDVPLGPYVFRLSMSDRWSAQRMVAAAKGYDRLGILVNVGPSGESIRAALLKDLQAIGKKPVASEEFAPGASDVTPQLLNLQKAGAQALLIQSLPGDTPTIWKDMQQIHYGARIIGHLGFADPVFRRTAGAAADGTFCIDMLDPENPAAKPFMEKYYAKYGHPDMVLWGSVAAGYDALRVMAAALKGANLEQGKLLAAMEGIAAFPVVEGVPGTTLTFSAQNHDGLGYGAAVGLVVQGKNLVLSPIMKQS